MKVDITEDHITPEQLRESFLGIAKSKVSLCRRVIGYLGSHVLQPIVTELDLRVANLPLSAIEYLREVMPSSQNEAGESEYDYEAWLETVFA